MRKFLPVDDLARDERFEKVTMVGRMADNRVRTARHKPGELESHLAHRKARNVGHDLDARHLRRQIKRSKGPAHVLDFTNDEAPSPSLIHWPASAGTRRHVEISVRLSEWMGTEIGEFAENTVLFEAACSHDPVLRLAGVNRALEGLAIDVFTTMKEFGELAGDPVLRFSEDWMLADEVTHVKMGSDWLRRLTENDSQRRKDALEFQQVVDKMFSFGGTRSESEESPIGLARRFRELTGFTSEEIDSVAEVSLNALHESAAERAKVRDEARGAFVHTLNS
jgi:hypothetical protein